MLRRKEGQVSRSMYSEKRAGRMRMDPQATEGLQLRRKPGRKKQQGCKNMPPLACYSPCPSLATCLCILYRSTMPCQIPKATVLKIQPQIPWQPILTCPEEELIIASTAPLSEKRILAFFPQRSNSLDRKVQGVWNHIQPTVSSFLKPTRPVGFQWDPLQVLYLTQDHFSQNFSKIS